VLGVGILAGINGDPQIGAKLPELRRGKIVEQRPDVLTVVDDVARAGEKGCVRPCRHDGDAEEEINGAPTHVMRLIRRVDSGH